MNALIYGATGGIGQEMCHQLLNRKYRLFLIGRSTLRVERLANRLRLPPSRTLCVDSITSAENYQRTVNWLESQQTKFQLGIHCAGYGCQKKAKELGTEEISDLLNVNLVSAFVFFKAFSRVKDMLRYDLIFFGSASVDQNWPNNSLYGASKAGLEYFAGSLQREVRQEGGRVWLYKPGSVNSGFFDNQKKHLPPEKMISVEELAKIVLRNLDTAPNIYFPPVVFRTD